MRVLDGEGGSGYGPAPVPAWNLKAFGVLKKIFTWWNGATPGILFTVGRRGVFVGQDEQGNKYYEAKDARDSYGDHKRRTRGSTVGGSAKVWCSQPCQSGGTFDASA